MKKNVDSLGIIPIDLKQVLKDLYLMDLLLQLIATCSNGPYEMSKGKPFNNQGTKQDKRECLTNI